MDIFLLIVEDRHAEVEVYPYSSRELALAGFAEYLESAGGALTGPDYELNESMIADSWIAYAVYSVEGDSVRVIRRQVDSP